MTEYDKQYKIEENLFGEHYPEFEQFLKEHAPANGRALDLGCGQGRDALLLARYGYAVTGVDHSAVGVEQMVQRGQEAGLSVEGIAGDIYNFDFPSNFDAIVLDSMLHFAKEDKEKELALLDQCAAHLQPNGYLFVFVHQSKKKEKILANWLSESTHDLKMVHDGTLDYVYQEQVSGFTSEFSYYFIFLQKQS